MIDSQADVRMGVVNVPFSCRIAALRFRLFGAGPSARSSLAQKQIITEHAKCVCLVEFVSSGMWLTEQLVRTLSATAHAQQKSLHSALHESPGWVN